MSKIARLKLNTPRQSETRTKNLGRVLLFCEGATEQYYFDHFASILKNLPNKYTDLEIKTVSGSGGGANGVFQFAEHFLVDELQSKSYEFYDKYLVFDCDAPDNIEDVIYEMKQSIHNYQLMLTNREFECWLVMHYEDPTISLSKSEQSSPKSKLSFYLQKEYKKASKGVIRQIIGDGERVQKAIKCAQELEKNYNQQGMSFETLERYIHQMNPYTRVHIFMEAVLDEMSRLPNYPAKP